MIKNTYPKEKDYLETYFTGQISLQNIKDYLDTLYKTKADKQDLKVLINGLNSILTIETTDIKNIANEVVKLLDQYNSIKIAAIVDNPLNTAYAILFKRLVRQERIRFELFSTELLAKKWMERKTTPFKFSVQE